MKMMAKFSFILCVIMFCLHVVSARTKVKPSFIDYDEDVIDDLLTDEQDITPIQQLDDDVPMIESDKVISNTNWNAVQCSPRPVPVPLPIPKYIVINGPRYVSLNRCLGAGNTAEQKCTASKREKVVVKYTDIMTMAQKEIVTMYNDIECRNDACVTKPADCNSNQVFENCICKCKINARYCESINRYYDEPTCKCLCKNPVECQLYEEWNPDTCRCECANCIKEMCQKHNLRLDSHACKCTDNIHARN